MVCPLSWCDAVSVHKIWANQCADEPDAFLNKVDGSAMQFQLVAPTDIAAKLEDPAIADQSANLIDPGSNRYHRCAPAHHCCA